MKVSVLGFGGAEIKMQGVSEKTVAELLGKALEAELSVIDTAACYGESEQLIGQAVGTRRDDFTSSPSCGHPHGMDDQAWALGGECLSARDGFVRQRNVQRDPRTLGRRRAENLDRTNLTLDRPPVHRISLRQAGPIEL
ncbi:MAG: aldo/keto reductase [Chthoniobacterales bacterium]